MTLVNVDVHKKSVLRTDGCSFFNDICKRENLKKNALGSDGCADDLEISKDNKIAGFLLLLPHTDASTEDLMRAAQGEIERALKMGVE